MKKEVLYVDEVKIVGHRHQDGSVEFFGKDAKIMELINEALGVVENGTY